MKTSKLLLIILFIGTTSFAQRQAEAPKLADPKSFTWVLLPDPQTYQKFGRNQSLFGVMIDWIQEQKNRLNIQMVLCTGDLVEQNNILTPDVTNGDQTSLQQWEAVAGAFKKLNGIVPYILCTGNHDYGIKSAENRYSQFNSFFPPQGNPLTYGLLVDMAENAHGIKTLENAAFEWKSPFGQKFLLFSLEFAPRAAAVSWAKQIAAKPAFKDHIGVVLTHSYLQTPGKRIIKENYRLQDATYGEAIWQQLVKPSSNIQFVLSGHIGESNSHRDQVGFRTDQNDAGKNVNQMVFNAQREGGGWHGNGGDGWLRILEFSPDKRTVKVSTFSPLFFLLPSTRNVSWRKASYDEFVMSY